MTTREDCVQWLLARMRLTTEHIAGLHVERAWHDDYESGPSVLYVAEVVSAGGDGEGSLIDLGAEPLRFRDDFTISVYGHICDSGLTTDQIAELGAQALDAVYLACARQPSPHDPNMHGLIGGLLPVAAEGPTVVPYQEGVAAAVRVVLAGERHLHRDDPDQVP